MKIKSRANISLVIVLISSIIVAIFGYIMSSMFADASNNPEKLQLLQSIKQSSNIEEIRAIAQSLHSKNDEFILIMSDTYSFISDTAIFFCLICAIALFKINRDKGSN